MKTRIHNLIQKGSHGQKANLIFDYSIMILILLSVISIILESIPEVNAEYGQILYIFNTISVLIFTAELLLRLYVCDLTHPAANRFNSVIKFLTSPFGIIDLLAILPFYLPMLIVMDLRFLRALRLVRFLRILKVNRYNNSLILIWQVIKEKKSELIVTGFLAFLMLLFASFTMYYVEGEQQPEAFPNILASFWWAVATLTTVGYGDVYPITGLGKFISGVIAIMGIGIIALPTGFISAGFMSKLEQKSVESKCPHCHKLID